jgi:hypothetical protein
LLVLHSPTNEWLAKAGVVQEDAQRLKREGGCKDCRREEAAIRDEAQMGMGGKTNQYGWKFNDTVGSRELKAKI